MPQNIVLIYFSRDGSTAAVAKMIAERYGAELLELREEKPRRGFVVSGYRATTGRRPALAGNPWSVMEGKDTVILGAPIWAGNGNPVLNSFLDKADLKGKKVVLFCLQADPDLRSSVRVLRTMEDQVKSRGGEPVAARAFHGNTPGKPASEGYLRDQLESWDLQL